MSCSAYLVEMFDFIFLLFLLLLCLLEQILGFLSRLLIKIVQFLVLLSRSVQSLHLKLTIITSFLKYQGQNNSIINQGLNFIELLNGRFCAFDFDFNFNAYGEHLVFGLMDLIYGTVSFFTSNKLPPSQLLLVCNLSLDSLSAVWVK